MTESESLFRIIAGKLEDTNLNISQGRMMSSPGIKYKRKVFAFYHADQMVFRLGKQFRPESVKLTTFSLLTPFKHKPPMSGWFQVPMSENHLWEDLSQLAMQKLRTDIDS